jgi:hypothetical protein
MRVVITQPIPLLHEIIQHTRHGEFFPKELFAGLGALMTSAVIPPLLITVAGQALVSLFPLYQDVALTALTL